MKHALKTTAVFFRSFVELMKESPIYRWSAIISFLLVVLTFAIPAWKILPNAGEQNFIPLHYNIYFGIDQFGPWYYVFFVPSLGLVLLLVNLIFETVYFRKEQVLSYFFALATLFSEIVLLVAVVLIVLLNL